MNRIQYHRLLNKKIEELKTMDTTATLLLHSCCAPCSSYVLEYLAQYFKITIFYYNPNISFKDEYARRVEEQKRLINKMNEEGKAKYPISFIEGNYEPERFFEVSKGLENEPEKGKRCTECFRLRLEEAARIAKEIGADYYTTTLTISPKKDAVLLNSIGDEFGEKYGVKHLSSDFKKNNGFERSIELSEQYGLYRQEYCGCVFSKLERESQEA